jgi:transketolase
VTLIASGSEVEIAMHAKAQLEADGIAVRVVSMPCMELFAALDAPAQEAVLPKNCPVVAVEAAISQGWDRWTGGPDRFIGMTGFGASAPYKQLYQRFGITAEAVAAKAKAAVKA